MDFSNKPFSKMPEHLQDKRQGAAPVPLDLRITSSDQIPEVLQKLKNYELNLRGKAARLKQFKEALDVKERQLKEYRKQILIAIKEELMQHPDYQERMKILDRFRDILEFVVKDIKEDIDEIMG